MRPASRETEEREIEEIERVKIKLLLRHRGLRGLREFVAMCASVHVKTACSSSSRFFDKVNFLCFLDKGE
jgi:hypothetical protein